jgi:hypothetical protein
MSLSFIGPKGAFERRWIVYALFRDNVQHHLEKGKPGADFAAIHSIADALGSGSNGIEIPAAKLRAEIEIAKNKLRDIPISDLAVSLRTRAVVTRSFPLPDQPATALAGPMGWIVPWPTGHAETVGELFESFSDELLKILGDGSGNDVVTIIDS